MPGDAVDPRHLDRLGAGHRRQDRRQPSGQHRLAGSGRRPRAAGCGRRPPRSEAPGVAWRDRERRPGRASSGASARSPPRGRQRRRRRPGDHIGRLAQVRDTGHREPLDERGLAGPLARHDQLREPGRMGSLRNRERPGRVAQLAAQRQLTEHGVGVQRLRRDLAARRQHPERQRRVEPGTHLAQERRRQVGRDPALRETRTPS